MLKGLEVTSMCVGCISWMIFEIAEFAEKTAPSSEASTSE
jgi:hypothetical protein